MLVVTVRQVLYSYYHCQLVNKVPGLKCAKLTSSVNCHGLALSHESICAVYGDCGGSLDTWVCVGGVRVNYHSVREGEKEICAVFIFKLKKKRLKLR